jgi:hypothetical protein
VRLSQPLFNGLSFTLDCPLHWLGPDHCESCSTYCPSLSVLGHNYRDARWNDRLRDELNDENRYEWKRIIDPCGRDSHHGKERGVKGGKVKEGCNEAEGGENIYFLPHSSDLTWCSQRRADIHRRPEARVFTLTYDVDLRILSARKMRYTIPCRNKHLRKSRSAPSIASFPLPKSLKV